LEVATRGGALARFLSNSFLNSDLGTVEPQTVIQQAMVADHDVVEHGERQALSRERWNVRVTPAA